MNLGWPGRTEGQHVPADLDPSCCLKPQQRLVRVLVWPQARHSELVHVWVT